MSVPPPKSAADEDKASLLSVDQTEDGRQDDISVTPKLEGVKKPPHLALSSNGFLSAPLSGPVRPLSPDTLSNLSLDEYEQIRPSRQTSRRNDGAAQSPASPPRGFKGKLHQFWARNKGLGYMLLAQVFGTLMNVTTRLLEVEGNKGKGLHPFQILFARMGITFILASSYMWWRRTPYFPLGMKEVRWLLVARGFGGFGGVFGMYYSLLYLPLADATVITFLAPSLACWACSILIKEPFTRVEKIAGLISLVGVVLIARPTSLLAALGGSLETPPATGAGDAIPATNGTAPGTAAPADASSYENVTPVQRLSAVGIALIGVLGSATAYTTIRWIGKRAHPLISVNYFAAGCFIVSVVMQAVLPGVGFLLPADAKEWGYLFFLGTCGFVMVCLHHLSSTKSKLEKEYDADLRSARSNSSWPPASPTKNPPVQQT